MTLNKYVLKKLAVLLLVFAVVLNLAMPVTAFAGSAPPTDVSGKQTTGFNSFQIITFNDAADYVTNIKSISVNQDEWNAVSSYMSVFGKGSYYVNKETGEIYFYSSALENGDTLVIQSEGYDDLTLEVSLSDGSFSVTASSSASGSDPDPTPDPDDNELKDPPVLTAGTAGDYSPSYRILTAADAAADYVSGITSIKVAGTEWSEAGAKIALYGSGYYLDKEANTIYFDGSNPAPFAAGDIITIESTGYKPLQLKVTDTDNFTAEVYDGEEEQTTSLFVRLVGSFESAIVNQEGYDATTSASTMVSTNKNSNVTVQVAVMDNEEEPSEDDWKDLSDSDIRIDTTRTSVSISSDDNKDSGMAGVYSKSDSSLTLSGTPTNAGAYSVSVTLTDIYGRTATSNSLTFKVYSGDEYLEDQLTLDNSTQTADGKYMYDMEPWAIKNFTKDTSSQTVTVPADIKAWYGSHTSGTYGELGYSVSGDPVQTLIVPKGCNLTLVNMKILSSVKIVVQDGGKLNLRDSSLHGQIVVENGGTFSMNYDEYSKQFLTGSSINGQLILNDGAILESSMIYSNTNFLPNGTDVRHNTDPVVVTNGNVTVDGQVFIRGDEAASGTDPSTGKSYSGQPALQVNGTLTITEGSVLAAYGGGKDATTSVGGDAVILNNGTITGDGKLIAVGGCGTFDNGGNAVTGTGTVSTAEAYLEGGSTYSPKEGCAAGSAAADGAAVTTEKKKLVEGQTLTTENLPKTYWSSILEIPDLTLYEISDASTDPVEPVDPEEPADPTDPDESKNPSTTIIYPSFQKPVIETSDGVSASLNSTGTMATITVEDGYELVDVVVNGVSKGKVSTLTGLKTGDKVVITAQKIDGGRASLIEAVKAVKLVARSTYAMAPSGKKSILVYWYDKDGSALDFDGYEVYRSLKKHSGYGADPIFKTTREVYFNTAITKGTKYYYKVRAYKIIDGQKVYTDYSLKAWRIAK